MDEQLPVVLPPEQINRCDHEKKWNTCPSCNNDFCKECWKNHDPFTCEV